MSKTPEAKEAYAMRREARLSRQKVAATLMPFFINKWHGAKPEDCEGLTWLETAAAEAVEAADELLDTLERTKNESA